jgi:hypothetical protein
MAHQQISAEDWARLGNEKCIAREQAIRDGKAWDARSTWGDTDFARRIEVTPATPKAKAVAHPISDADWDRLDGTDQMVRARAIESGQAWSPRGYDAAFTQRVAVPAAKK